MKVKSTGVRHAHTYYLDANHSHAEMAKAVADTAFDLMIENIVNHPRSLQKQIGPSELGIECIRALIHKLNQDDEPPRGPAWKPQVGTALHDQQERWFRAASAKGTDQENRYLVEQSVVVGQIGGIDHPGSTDLFDTWGNTVGDWKFVGPTRLKTYKANGPSKQYRTQAHLYGRGWSLDGWNVDLVMIFFIPRDGELSDSYVWSEPYNENVALEALERANKLDRLIKTIGAEQAISLYPLCDDKWCDWCAPENQVAAAKNVSPFAVK